MKQELFVYKVPDKNFMLAFESEAGEERTTDILNAAILAVMKGQGFNPFHQIGFPANSPGFHGWETWRITTAEEIEELIPLVLIKAQELALWW